ncbi:MAG: ORF6N domain-containing protein [Spirochaetales bacterium]|nr:ORF6N domain-containing protein [Spirochaetales bacterium]
MTISSDDIRKRIYTIRGAQVMLDADLAELYNVETRILNQAVKLNAERFPERFCFKLTEEELVASKSQFVILNMNKGR